MSSEIEVKKEYDNILVPDKILEKLSWAQGDITTAQNNFNVAYNVASGLKDVMSQYKADLDSIDSYTAGKVSTVKLNDKYSIIEKSSNNYVDEITEEYNNFGSIGISFGLFAETIGDMLTAVNTVLTNGDKEDIERLQALINGGASLDELFAQDDGTLLDALNEIGLDIKDASGELGKTGFGEIFKAKFGDLYEGAGAFTGSTALSAGIDLLNGDFSWTTVVDATKNLLEASLGTLASGSLASGSLEDTFLGRISQKLSETDKLITGVGVFALSFISNVAISAIENGTINLDKWDLIDAGVDATISTVSGLASEAIVNAVVSALGVSIGGGPLAMIATGVGVGLAFAGRWGYNKIKEAITTNGDGVPKDYKAMTIEQLQKQLDKNGIDFGLPKYDDIPDMSVYDVGNIMSRAGANPELITLVEAAGGANVPTSSLFDEKGQFKQSVYGYNYGLTQQGYANDEVSGDIDFDSAVSNCNKVFSPENREKIPELELIRPIGQSFGPAGDGLRNIYKAYQEEESKKKLDVGLPAAA